MNDLNQKIRNDVTEKIKDGGAIPARVFVTFDTEASLIPS